MKQTKVKYQRLQLSITHKCGNTILRTWNYCPYCGEKLEPVNAKDIFVESK